MPTRIGFKEYRHRALERELERFKEMFPQLGVEKAIVIGDLSTGKIKADSSLDLVIIQNIPGKFVRRMDFFTSHLAPELATNFAVYTPEEFDTLMDSNSSFKTLITNGIQIYGT